MAQAAINSTSSFGNYSTAQLVDELGQIKAEAAEIETREKALKAELNLARLSFDKRAFPEASMQLDLLSPRQPEPRPTPAPPVTTRPSSVPATLLAPIEELAAEASQYAERSRSRSTDRAYAADWRDFETWCLLRGATALPTEPGTLIAYITERARRLKVSSLSRRLAAISVTHQDAGHPSPLDDARFRKVWRGLRREKGVAVTRKAPMLTADMRRMMARLPTYRLDGLRNRALLLLGYAGALRRSELVGLDIADLDFARDGLAVRLRRSKTDQEGQGDTVPIPYGSDPATCPVRTVHAWLQAARITEGPAFRAIDRWGNVGAERLSGFAVATIVKASAARVGIDPEKVSGHSLRAGFATQSAQAEVPEADAMRHMRQKSVAVHRGYVRRATLFEKNPASRLGL